VAARSSALSGTVFNVQRASFHDGPGVRTTVFLKGCPLRCPWCHNPEGVAPTPQIIVTESRCLSCGACLAACPRPAGPLPSGATVGGDGCTACGACLAACPTAARQRVGERWTVAELLAEIRRETLVFETSKGGVTFSGGEPLAQSEFLLACLDACRREGVHTAVDTCGVAPREAAVATARRADLLLWDIKHLDAEPHRKATGAPLSVVLDNLAAAAAVGVPIWLRMPVIAGFNDDPATVEGLGELAARLRVVERICLLPYHRTGTAKAARLGQATETPGFAAPPQERLTAMAARLTATGIAVSVGG